MLSSLAVLMTEEKCSLKLWATMLEHALPKSGRMYGTPSHRNARDAE